MGTTRLAHPVRGVHVRSPKTVGNCAPDFGSAEIDFEPLPDGQPSVIEYACAPASPDDPEQWSVYIRALAGGALTELAATGDNEYFYRTADPVAARVVIRAITFHPTDSCEGVFTGLGALATREALSCIVERRHPTRITRRISCRPHPGIGK